METLENGRATPVWAFESRIHRTAYGGSAMLLALPFVAFGGYLSLAGFGYLPLLGTAHAPPWVIGAVGVTFALAGAILLGYAVRGLSARRRVAELQRRCAAQPWLRDYPWDPQGIEDQPAGGWVRLLGLTAVVAALAVPFNWWAFASGEGTWMVRIAAAGMDLVVLVSALAFLYRLAAALKFGRSRLSFSRFPFSRAMFCRSVCRQTGSRTWMSRCGSSRNGSRRVATGDTVGSLCVAPSAGRRGSGSRRTGAIPRSRSAFSSRTTRHGPRG